MPRLYSATPTRFSGRAWPRIEETVSIWHNHCSRPESTGFGRVGIESLSKVVSKSSEPNGANPECDSTVRACKTRFPAGFDGEESTFVKVSVAHEEVRLSRLCRERKE